MKPKYKTLNGASSNEFNAQRQGWNIDKWFREQGLDMATVMQHPNITDVRTLLDYEQYEGWMTAKDREIWRHAWKWVYKKQLPISVYIEKRLLSIVQGCEQRKLALAEYKARCQKRNHIHKRLEKKQSRQALNVNFEIGDHNDEAKGSQSATNPIYGLVQQDDGSARIRARQIIEVR